MKTELKNKTIDDLHCQISTNETRFRAMKVASGKDAANLDEMESEINNLYNEVVRVDNLKPLSNNSRIEFMQSIRKWNLRIGPLRFGRFMINT